MKTFLSAVCLLAGVATATAQPAGKTVYYLEDGVAVPKQVTSVVNNHADELVELKKQVAALTEEMADLKWRLWPAKTVEGWPPPKVVKPLPVARIVVPAGSHAHTRTDGSVFVHGDENHGNAAAHVGVALPWNKTATAGQTVVVGDPCPGGVCPTSASAVRYSASYAESYSVGPAPLFPRLRAAFRR